MRLPILKYYLTSSLSLKLRCYFTKASSETFVIEKTSIEHVDRESLECLIYAPVDACDPHLLSSVNLLLSWLDHYLAKKPATPLPPLAYPSSPFTLLTLNHLAALPLGETLTYQELAIRMGHPKAARAVGNALNKNPFPLLLPCHRIVSKKDGIGGFAYSLTLKELLLRFERKLP